MSLPEKSLGTIDVSPNAVVTIVSHSVNQCYGVVGMASKKLVNGIAKLLSRDSHPGIDVRVLEEGIEIDVYVIVEYGVRIKAVAESLQNTIRFHVEQAMATPVTVVNVFVQGLRRDE